MSLAAAPDRLVATTTAVLVIDMQNDYLHAAGFYPRSGCDAAGLRQAIPSISLILRKARTGGAMVVFTRMVRDRRFRKTHDRTTLRIQDRTVSGERLSPGAWGTDLIAELTALPGEVEVSKHACSAFEGTDLEGLLRAQGVKTLVVCGITTHACVLATAFSAFDKGFDLLLATDAVGSWSPALDSNAQEIFRLLLGTITGASSIGFTDVAQ